MNRFSATLHAQQAEATKLNAANLPVRRDTSDGGRSLGMAVSGWASVKLGELVEIKHGWPFKSEHFHEDLTGQPVVVSVGNFRYTGGFRFTETSIKEYRDSYPKEYELAAGDMLLIMTCQTAGGEILGIPARVPDDGRAYLHNQRLGKVVIRQGASVVPDFLYWLFLWHGFNRELVTSASGTKILHTAPSRIEAFRFDLPPKDEQRAIAHILGTLDDKIELNRQMNETLEAMVRALFKSWFVDFLPVRANMEARNRKARTQTGDPVRTKAERRSPGLPRHIADRFPDSFEDSELGEIPKGWRAAPFREAAVLYRDTVNPLDMPDAEFVHFSIPAYDEGGTPKCELGATIKSLKFRVPDDGILFSKLNPAIERVWLVDFPLKATAVCSTEFLVFRARSPFTRAFVYSLSRSSNFRCAIQSSVTGTSNSHQRTQPDSVLSILSPLPSHHIIDAFEKIVAPLLLDIQIKNRESRTLAALRDTLLPKLISGELRLKATNNQLQSA